MFILQVEENARYIAAVEAIFRWVEIPGRRAVTSTVTMLELLVRPYRMADLDQVDLFYSLLSTYPNLEWAVTDLNIADRAAELRARKKLRTPDAIQIATAIASGATGYVTNDKVFKRVNDIDVLLLDDLLV